MAEPDRQPEPRPYDESADLFGCYYAAIAEYRRRWEAGDRSMLDMPFFRRER